MGDDRLWRYSKAYIDLGMPPRPDNRKAIFDNLQEFYKRISEYHKARYEEYAAHVDK